MPDSNDPPRPTDGHPSSETHPSNTGFWTNLSVSAKNIMTHVENTLHEWFSMSGIRPFPDTFTSEDEVFLLGKHYSSEPNEIAAMKEDFACRPHFTYRHSFPPIENTKYTSDSGWGCMIRVGQCLLLEGLMRLKFGRNFSGFPTDAKFKESIELFLDSPTAPFSIHSISEKGSQLDTLIGNWFGPTIVAQALKKIALEHDSLPRIVVAQDATVFLPDVEEAFTQSSLGQVLLFIPLRLGISNVHPSYFSFIKAFLSCSTAIGIAGGRPSSALFVVGYFRDTFLVLDPHVTQPCLSTNFESIRSNQILCLPFPCLDPSLCVGFAFQSKTDWEEWKAWIKQEKEEFDIPFSLQDMQWKEEENMDFLSESDKE